MPVEITQTDDLATCHALRSTVFIDEQNVSEAEEMDGRDGDALHVLAREDGVPIGTARIFLLDGTAKIGRVCVLKPHRGRGLGAQIMRYCLSFAAQKGAQRAVLGAQMHALGFYEQLGFIARGPIYDDAGIPHRDMVRDL